MEAKCCHRPPDVEVKGIPIDAKGLGFDFRTGQVGRSVANVRNTTAVMFFRNCVIKR